MAARGSARPPSQAGGVGEEDRCHAVEGGGGLGGGTGVLAGDEDVDRVAEGAGGGQGLGGVGGKGETVMVGEEEGDHRSVSFGQKRAGTRARSDDPEMGRRLPALTVRQPSATCQSTRASSRSRATSSCTEETRTPA